MSKRENRVAGESELIGNDVADEPRRNTVPPGRGVSPSMRAMMTPGTIVSNIPHDGPDCGRLTFKLLAPPDYASDMIVGKTFALSYFSIEATRAADPKTGQPRTRLAVTLIDDEGNSYFAVNDRLAASVDAFVSAYGPGPWEPGVAVEFRGDVGSKRRRAYTIHPVGPGG